MKRFEDFGIHIGTRSGNVKTFCPECRSNRSNKTDKSLSVNTGTGVWNCHYCGWKGGLGKDRVEYQPYQFREKPPKVYKKPDYKPAEAVPSPTALDYLKKSRGLTDEVLRRNQVGTKKAWFPQTNTEIGAITFPYFRDGEVVNVKYRTRDKLFRMEKDAESTLYGVDDIQAGQPLIWVEGEIDKLSFEVAGYLVCVSVPNGGKVQEMEFLEPLIPLLETVSAHIIAVDNDTVGRGLRDELIRRLGPERCWQVQFPDDCKDANDVLLKYGTVGLDDLYTSARPVPIAGYIEVCDVREEVIDLYENGLKPGPSVSDDGIAAAYKPRPGEFTVATGIPGHGKSTWLDWLTHDLAETHGWQIAVFSPENRVSRHISNLCAIHAREPFTDGPTPRMSKATLNRALDWVNGHYTFFAPEDDITLDNVLALARAAVLRRGVRGLVIDPYNEIDHSLATGETETEYIRKFLTKIRVFARNNGIHIWLVAHPAKLLKDRVNGDYPVPTPYDISGSAHFRNKADMCIAVHRNLSEEGQPVELHVQKVRFRENGKLGVVQMDFNPAINHYQSRFNGGFYAPPPRPEPDGDWGYNN